MKKTQILYVGLALVAGLLAGYWLFGGSNPSQDTYEHQQAAEENLWTCSMHPQILRTEPGNCPICGMELVPVEANEAGSHANMFRLTENALALANIKTMPVGEGMSTHGGMVLSGKIEEDEEASTVQAAYYDGRIEKLFINTTGETVQKGQPLALIYAPELVAAQQELISAKKLKEAQPALYEAVKNKLKLWKLSDKQIGAIETSGQVQQNVSIQATVSGTVTDKMAEEGDYVKEGQPLLKITGLNTVWAVFDAYEQQLASLKRGQELSITSNAYPNKVLKGKISLIEPVLNTQTRTVKVRVVLSNADGNLKPGMFVKARLQGQAMSDQTSLKVPSAAVMWTGERSLVYVKPDPERPKFEMREVVLGHSDDEGWVEILEGLQAGEEVVVNGTFTVDAAAQLQGKASMMNRTESMPEMNYKNHSESGEQQAAYQEALMAYFRMKDALVEGDPESAAEQATKAIDTLNNGPDSGNERVLASLEALQGISGTKDLKQQRAHFVKLNESWVALWKSMQPGRTVYVIHCPMADDNRGADWLSLESVVKNPYFGTAMLTCGSVTDTLK